MILLFTLLFLAVSLAVIGEPLLKKLQKRTNKQDPDAPSDRKVILVVEDNRKLLHVIEEMLDSLNYEVLVAENSDKAIEFFLMGQHVDLILADITLPGGFNGPMLVRRILRLQPVVKIIYTSGYARPALVKSGIIEESDHFLTKPLRKPVLAAKIAEVLEDET